MNQSGKGPWVDGFSAIEREKCRGRSWVCLGCAQGAGTADPRARCRTRGERAPALFFAEMHTTYWRFQLSRQVANTPFTSKYLSEPKPDGRLRSCLQCAALRTERSQGWRWGLSPSCACAPMLRTGGTRAGLLEKPQVFLQNVSDEMNFFFSCSFPIRSHFLRSFLSVQFHFERRGLISTQFKAIFFSWLFCLFVFLPIPSFNSLKKKKKKGKGREAG